MALIAAVATMCPALPAAAQTVSGPVALSCPAIDEVRRELPSLNPSSGWTVTLGDGPGGERALTIRDATGVVLLSRRFVFQPDDCGAAPRAVAIVVERYLRDLYASREDPPPPEPVAPPMRAERPAGLLLSAGPIWQASDSRSVSGSFEVRLRLWRFLEGSATLLAPATRREQPVGADGGRALVASTPVRLRLLAATSGRLPVSVGIDGLLLFERGEAAAVARPTVQRRLVYLMGPSAGLAVPLGGRWRLSADLGVYRALPAAPFVVRGVGEVLAPAAWRAMAGMQLGWAAWP
jgi:hypothetical protein